MPTLYIVSRGSYNEGDNDRRLFWSKQTGPAGAPNWSVPVVMEGKGSYSGPALAVFQDKLYAAWRGAGEAADDQNLYWANMQLGNGVPQPWSDQKRIGISASYLGPAIASFQGKLFAAWRGVETDHNLYWSVFDGLGESPSWSPQCKLSNRGSARGPSLAAFEDRLFMAWRGVHDDRTLYWSTFDGGSPSLPCDQQWSPQHRDDQKGSEEGPALVVFEGNLCMFWRGIESDTSSDQRIFFSRFNGTGWEPQAVAGPLKSFRRPALASFRGTLSLADMGTISEPPGGVSGAGGDPPDIPPPGPGEGSGGPQPEPGGGSPEPQPGPTTIVEVDLTYTTFAGNDFASPVLPAQSTGLTSIASPAMAVFPEVTSSVRIFLTRHGFDPRQGLRQAGGTPTRHLMGLE